VPRRRPVAAPGVHCGCRCTESSPLSSARRSRFSIWMRSGHRASFQACKNGNDRALCLCAIHRRIGIAHQIDHLCPSAGEQADTDRSRQETVRVRRGQMAASKAAMISRARTPPRPRCAPLPSEQMNSSPPRRASMSIKRTCSERRAATATSSSSPTPCPRESLTCLNWSRSINSTARLLLRAARIHAGFLPGAR
jgi:hypothetical protein